MKINRSGMVLALLLAVILAGCKGSSSTTPVMGSANVSLTDGVGSDYDHVWVTVKAISFHTDPNQPWDGSAGWQTTTLAAPVTLDLTTLTNGALNKVFAGMSLPVGGYRQIRLFLAGFDDTLTASASTAGLTYNDQVDYTDAVSTVHHVPLEIAYPTQGIQLNGSFDVAVTSVTLQPIPLNLAVDFDLEHDLVRFKHGTEDHFTMKPNLRYFDLDQSGAINGTVVTTNLCSTTVLPTCGYNVIVKAEILSADGTRHHDIRSTTIDPITGNFSLYPLPSGTSYDVLIRGRNVETMLVKGMTAPIGSTPASGVPAVLSTTAIPLTIDIVGEYFANFSAPLAPTSGYALFQQTLPGIGEVPYEVRWENTDPFTGIPELPVALSNDPLQVASYNAGGALTFNPVTPQETSGGYSVATNALPLAYYNLSSSTLVASSGAPNIITSPLTFAPPTPTLSSSVVLGTVSGTITQTTHGNYDSGYLVVSRFANIVDTVNISTQLAANGGTYSVTLPAGGWLIPGTADYANVPGAYYYAYLRVWNSANPLTTLKVIPIISIIDLRNVSTLTGINVTLP
jgi:hypothetical protein